mgnify:CR=1 FL=1
MIKALIKIFFGVAVLAVVLVFAGGYWIENNADTVAQAALDASGASEDMAAQRDLRCETAQRQFQSAWDESVERGTDERDADMLDMMESQARIACDAS